MIMQRFITALQEYKIIFKYWLLFLSIGFVFRVILAALFIETYDSNLLYSFLYGFRMDTIAFSALTLLFMLFYAFNFIFLTKVFYTLSAFTYFIVEIITIGFIDKFFSRPNHLFIEHLHNYKEIFTMIWELYTLYLFLLILCIPIVIYVLFRFFSNSLNNGKIPYKVSILPLILAILFLGTRSSLGSSTPNQGFYTFSTSKIHNELANNSIFSILYSVYLLKKEKFYHYGEITNADALENVKKLSNIKSEQGLYRYQQSLFSEKKNIILVILESFGHEHIGHLGGTPTTPNLDQFTKESLYFTNLYAIGTRTSWGVSSVLSSLYPIPSREYVKASNSQKDFYTIARTLKKHNYTNTFIYSGDVDFDNMRGFLLSNGYDDVYGKENFDSDLEVYTWGYCDEDLYDKAFTLAKNSQDKPFFITLLTMSSHEPFDYPKGKVDPYKGAKLEGFANSIKYADYAIGKFIRNLKEAGLMKNTVVAFIADHNNDAYGSFDVPIDRYKILAMILSDDFKGGKEYDKIASQIDFGPTLLDIAGVSDTIPTMGSSVLQTQKDSALLLAHKKNFAYLLKDKFILYKENKDTKSYNYELKQIANDEKSVYDGLSYIYASKYIYENKDLYK